MEGVALQGPPHDQNLGVPKSRRGAAELLGDVGGYTGVGRGRGGQDGCARGQPRQQGADASVVGAEVMAPVRDAVGLVDDDQAGARGEGC